MSPLLSVVIPVHNRANDLQNAIASINLQNIELEIIFVDDASTDDSAAAIEQLALTQSNVRFSLLTTNQGGGHARNVGIDMAQGQWIAFLDSDDLWLPGKISAQLKALQSLGNIAALCFTNLVVDFHDNAIPLPWNAGPFLPDENVTDYLLRKHQVVQTSTIVMSAATAKRIRFDDKLRRHQDIDFVLRCAVAGVKFVYVDECLVRYSANPMAARVSKRVNSAPSLKWLEVAQSYLTPQEINAFYLKQVFDMHFKDAPAAAVRRSWRATLAGSQSMSEFANGLARQLAPLWLKTLRNSLKRK